MMRRLVEFAKYPVPQNVLADVRDLAGRWGRVQLVRQDGELVLTSRGHRADARVVTASRRQAVSRGPH